MVQIYHVLSSHDGLKCEMAGRRDLVTFKGDCSDCISQNKAVS